MRLSLLHEGHSLPQKLALGVIRLIVGDVPGPISVMSYRRDLFGKYLAACLDESMRKMTEWSLGEVELFAAFVSQKNSCAY